MKLAQLLEQLNQLAEERPEALEMVVIHQHYTGDEIVDAKIEKLCVDQEGNTEEMLFLVGYTPF
jgi:hypothetical protein